MIFLSEIVIVRILPAEENRREKLGEIWKEMALSLWQQEFLIECANAHAMGIEEKIPWRLCLSLECVTKSLLRARLYGAVRESRP